MSNQPNYDPGEGTSSSNRTLSTRQNSFGGLSSSISLLETDNLDPVFAYETKEYLLNNCGSKRLVVGIVSPETPALDIKFRLHDTKHRVSIEFSKKKWRTIMAYKEQIRTLLTNGNEDEVYMSHNFSIKVTKFYQSPCVSFTNDILQSIVMQRETFEKMVSLEHEIDALCNNYIQQIKNISSTLKLLIDSIFIQIRKNNHLDQETLFGPNSVLSAEQQASIRDVWQKLSTERNSAV